MSKKNMGRKFKVGDKVKLTKKGKYSDYFCTDFNAGDTAEIVSMNNKECEILVTSGHAEGNPQFIAIENMFEGWISHLPKKKRKYFRTGDFVTLKDEVDISEVTKFSDFKQGAIGIVAGYTEDGMMGIEYFYGKGFNFDHVKPEALRLATKEERKSLRKHKVAKITYDDVVTEEIKQDTETVEAKIPPEYDVKVGDIVEVTKHSCGHSVGAIVKVVEVRPLGYFSEYNTVRAVGFDGREWSEDDVKLVHRAMSICEDEDNSEPNSAVTPATEEEKMVMCDDKIVSRTGSVYHVHDIDTSVSPLTYRISVEKESSWTELVKNYAKLLEDGRVYDWATDTTFANVESWIKTTK